MAEMCIRDRQTTVTDNELDTSELDGMVQEAENQVAALQSQIKALEDENEMCIRDRCYAVHARNAAHSSLSGFRYVTQCTLEMLLIAYSHGTTLCKNAVSYTHLDVYKRQV